MAVNHPHFGTFCEICFKQLTPETCAVDLAGVKWDVCPGECARDAGVSGAPPCPVCGAGPGVKHDLAAHVAAGTLGQKPLGEEIAKDFQKVFADIEEAIATGREPEDVQRERHARERRNLT